MNPSADGQPQPQHSRRTVPPRAETQVKGLAFRTNVECFVEIFGTPERLLNACPTELRDALVYSQIVPGGWYPVHWYRQLLRALITASGRPAEEFMLGLGELAANRDINGVYRTLIKLLKPGTVLSVYARLFPKYYSRGKLTVITETDHSCRIQLTECGGFDRNMYVEILGSAQHLMRLTGARQLAARITAGGRDHADYVTYDASWE